MMSLKISPEIAIRFTKASVALSFCWPPSPEATTWYTCIFNCCWYMCFINSLTLLFPLLTAVYENRLDSILLTKSICLSCAVAQIIFKMVLCRQQRSRLRVILFDLEKTCKKENEDTLKVRAVLEAYVEKCKYVHVIYTSLCYLTAIIVICSPLYTNQKFPTDAKYFFPVDHHLVKVVIFLHQSLVGLQVSAGMCIDCQLAILLWYVGAKFEALSKEISEFKKEQQLNACFRKHQEVLRYSAETKDVISYLVLTTMVTTTVGIIFAGLNIVDQQPLAVKVQYAFVMCVASAELLIYAWPADNLINTSTDISWNVYHSNWLTMKPRVWRKLKYCIMRSQKSETIRVGKILPPLRLQYYASFLTSSFSYFTALRAVIGNDE